MTTLTALPALVFDAPHVWTQNCLLRAGVEVRVEHSRRASQVVDFGLKDAKGRAIGTYVEIEVYRRAVKDGKETVAYPGGHSMERDSYRLEEAETFHVSTHATRDGKPFGACVTGDTKCASLEEALAVAAKKVAEAQKRFAKKVEKGEGRQFAKR